jgi:hypothetical protein
VEQISRRPRWEGEANQQEYKPPLQPKHATMFVLSFLNEITCEQL